MKVLKEEQAKDLLYTPKTEDGIDTKVHLLISSIDIAITFTIAKIKVFSKSLLRFYLKCK